MKKLIILICMISVVLSLSVGITAFAAEVQVGDSITYKADFSEGLPEDWTPYNLSDYKNGTALKTTGGISLTHSNSSISESQYYGSLYQIATSLGSVEDFDISMTFRYLSYDNTSRWIAILYHTKLTDGKLEGYDMNLRVNGESAQSTISSTPSFKDADKVKTGSNPADKNLHIMRITCNDGDVKHYFDDSLIHSYKLSDKYGVLGGVQNEGGFAIIVNRSSIEITSLTISGTKGEENVNKYGVKASYAETYIPQTRLVAAPAVITDISSQEKLDALSNTIVPQNAVFTINGDLDIIDKNRKKLGAIDEVLNEDLISRAIPVIRIDSLRQADQLVKWLEKSKILDFAVVSTDISLLQRVRSSISYSRAILDCTEEDNIDLSSIVANANKAMASTVVLAEKEVTRANVEYLQARLKAVWVNTEASTEFAVADLVSTGVYGIWLDNYEVAYNAYKNYADLDSLSRTPFNIAHRGLCLSFYENTLEGCIEAYNSGATHFEIDLKLTKDEHIVIMHDDDISRTTNGSGIVSSMTLAELRKYKVVKNYNGAVIGAGVNIPTLEEFFDEFENKDIVLVLELKSSDSRLVYKLASLLKERPEMVSKIIVIAFDPEQLDVMKTQLPEIPTANLNAYTYNGFVDGLIMCGYYNTVPDTGYGNVNEYFMANEMLVRGFMGYCWTYGSNSEVANYYASGVLGMTNNVADTFGVLAKELTPEKDYVIGGQTVSAIVKDYLGNSTTVNAEVFMRELRADGEYVILKYRFSISDNTDSLSYTLYSRAIKLIDSDIYMSPEKIENALDELSENITLDDLQTITAIRQAYDALPENDRSLISNSGKLIGAEKTLERLANNVDTPENNNGVIIGIIVVSVLLGLALICLPLIVIKYIRRQKLKV